jgi:hypothetical protein
MGIPSGEVAPSVGVAPGPAQEFDLATMLRLFNPAADVVNHGIDTCKVVTNIRLFLSQ